MKFIEGTGERYTINENGEIFDIVRNRIVKQTICDNNGYYRVWLHYDGGKYIQKRIHRLLAEAFLPDYDSTQIVDHRDNNKLNNHIDNLRMATFAQNCQNVSKQDNTTSQYKGICYHKVHKKWHAKIGHNKKRIHIGYYENEIDAARAYNEVANNLFGEFAKLNVIN